MAENQKEWMKNRYETRKSAGICTWCGANPARDGKVLCEVCAEKAKQQRDSMRKWRKDNGICVKCGNKKADDGYTMCLVCRMNEREIQNKHKMTKEQQKHSNEKHRERYEQRKSNHECVRCGKKMLETWDKISCPICSFKINKRLREWRYERGTTPQSLMGNGVYCAQCGKLVEEYGKKLCNRCYERSCKTIEKNRKSASCDNYMRQSINAQWREAKSRKVG